MNLPDELKQYLTWCNNGGCRDLKNIITGMNGIIDRRHIALETIKTELRAIIGKEESETLFNIFKNEELDVQLFLINEAIRTSCMGADYSACRNMEDFKKVYATAIYSRYITPQSINGERNAFEEIGAQIN